MKGKMKILKVLPIALAPLFLMSYGWYLGQLHQSGPDIAGILLFFTGALGLMLALITFYLTRKKSWHWQWYANALLGLAGCGAVFALMLLIARLHG